MFNFVYHYSYILSGPTVSVFIPKPQILIGYNMDNNINKIKTFELISKIKNLITLYFFFDFSEISLKFQGYFFNPTDKHMWL